MPVLTTGKEALWVLAALFLYRTRILPVVSAEIERWRRAAAEIPDPSLRRFAEEALSEKVANVEATAVFALLAPRQSRVTVIRAIVSLQVAIDYLDTLGEQPTAEPLESGLQLHRALGAGLTPGAAPAPWYSKYPSDEDGGYLDRLVASRQADVATLPAHAAVLPIARRAAVRCGEGQSYTHAAAAEGSTRRLDAWASKQGAAAIFSPWEVAAGASSSVAAHALIAAAGDQGTGTDEAEAIDAAYFPAIGALTVLLDDLVDQDEDAGTGHHSFLNRWSSTEAADRLDLILGIARGSLEQLRQRRRHAAILTGIVAYYLGASGAQTPYAAPVRERLLASSGPELRLISAFLRLRRHA